MRTLFFERPDGTLAYDDTGSTGPGVLLVPGMGNLRHEYRLLVPRLTAAGYRVITLDLRGHGESSTGWREYSVAAIGQDMLALLDYLGTGPAFIIGTSFAAGAAVVAAAEQPAAITGVVLIAAFVRDHPLTVMERVAMQLLLTGPWRVHAWDWYYSKLYPTQPPPDFLDYRARLRANLAEPGRFAALRAMMHQSQADAAARLQALKQPALVIMGTRDPDFLDPEAEARFIAEALAGEVHIHMVVGAGHYPHTEMPDQTAPAVLRFLERLISRRTKARSHHLTIH